MKKILGMPIALFVIGLVMIGGASALIVNYLSNQSVSNVAVKSPMELSFAKISNINDETGTFTRIDSWTTDLEMVETTGLSTSTLGIQIKNNADVDVEKKWLQLNITNSIKNVECEDLTSLQFFDVGASPSSGNRRFQELSGTGLCTTMYRFIGNTQDVETYAQYNIDLNLLEAGHTYDYPAKLTFGTVAPATYVFSAQIVNDVVV